MSTTRQAPAAANSGDITPQTTIPESGQYEIDVDRSTVRFSTRHLFGVATVRGSLAIRSGSVTISEPPASSRVYAELEAASFRTGNGQRDASVRSRRFLAAGTHPVIIFAADAVAGQMITGTLTVQGQSDQVSLAVTSLEGTPQSFTVRATTRIDRTAFGITAAPGLAARYLDVVVEVRCVRG
jgi:polyisoprenoid-binding protein YceI